MLRIPSYEDNGVRVDDDECALDARWTADTVIATAMHKKALIDAPMSVPMPAIPAYLTSNNPTILAHGRRKSIPSRSASRDDMQPGVIFRMDNSEIHLLNTFACFPCRSSTNLPMPQPVPLPALLTEREEAWDWASSGRSPSSSAFNGGGLVTGKSGSNSGRGTCEQPQRIVTTRQRSFSLTERPKLSQTEQIGHGQPGGGSPNEVSDSDTEPYGTSPANPGPKRRSSIACGQGPVNVYTGSLAHLVPNAYLQTTSRRISTHSSAPGCLCTSCGSTVTPYWRDGWSEHVMLCNACGLRFQKFARRCPACMYIPRKEDSLGDRCIKCNNFWIVGPAS